MRSYTLMNLIVLIITIGRMTVKKLLLTSGVRKGQSVDLKISKKKKNGNICKLTLEQSRQLLRITVR